MKISVRGNDDGYVVFSVGVACAVLFMASMTYATYARAMLKHAIALERKLERTAAENNARYRESFDETH